MFLLLTKQSRDWKRICLSKVLVDFDGLLFGFGGWGGFLDDSCGEASFMAGKGFIKFDGIKGKIIGFIGSVVTRTTFYFFLPFEFFSGPGKFQILIINLSVSLYKLGGFQGAMGEIFRFISGERILMQGIIKVIGLIGVKGVDILHDLFSADVEWNVDIDGFAIGILLDGRIVVHWVIT